MSDFTDSELAAFLEEALVAARSAELEHRLRSDAGLRDRLLQVRGREHAGLHTLGAIWRRWRLSCPSRGELGQFLLGTLEPEPSEYVRFHMDETGCRYCQANLEDLQAAGEPGERSPGRRTRFFQTSAGYLRARSD